MRVLAVLACGPARFSELESAVPGLSRATLSDRLRVLASAELVRRTVDLDRPITSSDALIGAGEDLCRGTADVDGVRDRLSGSQGIVTTRSASDVSAVEVSGAALPSVATELRRRRELLGWSQVEAATRSGISRTVINEIERGRRAPSTRTYEKLRDALGLSLPTATALLHRPAPGSHTERQLTTLAACLVSTRGGTLAAYAQALGVSVPAVREQLSLLDERLAAVGVAVVEDGSEVRVVPAEHVVDALSRLTTLEVQQQLTDEAVQVLVIVGMLGSPTRREIEDRRLGEDCASLLERMVRRGLLEKARDDALRGDPNIYRLTAVALGAMGHATLDSFQAWCQAAVAGSSGSDGDAH